MLKIFIFFERFAPQGHSDFLSAKHLEKSYIQIKNCIIFNKNIKPRHSEHSDESMQQIDSTGFFAMLRMTKLTALAIKKLHTYDFSMTFVGELADLGI